MIESKKDGPIGYFFCFLDRGYIVWKTVALLPSYQGMGLTNSAVHWVCKRAVESGYEKLICALMKKDAPSVPLMKKVSNELWSHEYLVLGKSL